MIGAAGEWLKKKHTLISGRQRLDANYHPPSTPLYEYSDWAIPLPREYQEAPQFAADIVPLEPSASFHPWMLSTNDPFPILPGTHTHINFGAVER